MNTVPDGVAPCASVTSKEGAGALEVHRPFLFRVAHLQLGCEEDARDVVQDTLVAAVTTYERWSGLASLRSWLLGILRHKIVDAIRVRTRYVRLDPQDALSLDLVEFDEYFEEDDSWRPEAICHGQCPQEAVARRQLLDVVEFCVAKLPCNTGRVFLMREFLGMEFDEIASELELSPGNLRVLLYRARMRLRDCVSRGWGADNVLQ